MLFVFLLGGILYYFSFQGGEMDYLISGLFRTSESFSEGMFVKIVLFEI